MLKQPQYRPMPVEYQVIIIFAATEKYLLDVPVESVTEFEKGLFEYLDTRYPEIPESIRTEKAISEGTDGQLRRAIEEFRTEFLG